ncbi:MAG: MATE family efflux transporter [Christensenella sp.]
MENTNVLNQNIYRTFFKYVSLNILSMLGVSLYVLADTFFVANGVGTDGLVALNLALPAYSVINGTGLLIGIGAATLFSIATGKGQRDAGSRIFTQAFVLAAGCGVVLTLIGLFFNRQISVLLGASGDNIIGMTAVYLKMLLLFSCAFIINNLMVAFVRNDGNPRLAMIGMLSSCLFNIVFDYIFVFPMQLGIFGAALATGVSPILSIMILSTHFMGKKSNFKLKRVKFKAREMQKTVLTGVPSFVTEFSSGVIIFMFNAVIMKIAGDAGVAAYGIIANLALVCVAIFTGIGQGVQPVIGVNYGAGRMDNVRRVYLCGAALAILLGALFFITALLFPTQIASAFNSGGNAELATLTSEGIGIYFFGFLFAGVNVVTVSLFASIAHTRQSFLLSLLRGFVLILPLLILLPRVFGITGVWMTSPTAECATFLCCIAFVITFFKKHKSAKSLTDR